MPCTGQIGARVRAATRVTKEFFQRLIIEMMPEDRIAPEKERKTMNSANLPAEGSLKNRCWIIKITLCMWLIIFLPIASCVPIDRWNGGSYGGSGEDGENRRRAANTCRDYADRQRLNVMQVISVQPLGAGNDYEVRLRLRRGVGVDEVTCYTDVRTGSTRIADAPSYGGSRDDEENRRRAANTCRDYAERQRLNVLQIMSSQSRGGGNDYEVRLRVRRGIGLDEVTCYTDVRTGSTRIVD
jgi:hypothetical protein